MSISRIGKKVGKRQGMILLVVLAMLTLLAIIGITFVMYASSLEQCSEAAIDEQKIDARPRFDPETALSVFLGQFVYDAEDDAAGFYSVLRGHSLARDLYGYTPAGAGNAVTFPLDRPFGGAGYADPNSPNFQGQSSLLSGQPNVPYTAPDTRHWYLAKLAYNAQGQLIVNEPSFWRNSVSANPATSKSTFRYRPNQEMASGFPPYPTQAQQYDVQNWPLGTANDSIWIDINAPVQTLPNGKKFKMLVAPLIVDLDGRLNLAMAGNKMTSLGGTWFHGSHEGHGPWEANIDRVTSLLAAQGDPVLTSLGISSIQSTVLATKYGAYGFPYGMIQTGGGSGSGSSTYSPRAHNQVDFNGGVDPNPQGLTGPVPSMLPGSVGGVAQPSQSYQAFPYFHPGMYGNWAYNETTNNGQSTGTYIHPNAYNPLFPNGSQSLTGFNVAFAIRDMGPLLLWRSDKDAFAKDQGNTFFPVKQGLNPLLNNYGVSGSRSNFFDHVTLLSADFDKPGIAPYVSGNMAMTGLEWASPTTAPYRPRRTTNNFTQPPTSEQNTLGLATRTLTRFARINLGVFGPDYPVIDPTTGQYAAAEAAIVTAADQGRTLLATKVLEGLCAATGTPDMRAFVNPTDPQYRAWVWLAQVAVNIVDFVDPDDVMTTLDLSPSGMPGTGRKVYGTELPKVVINEIYAQIDNGSAGDFGKTGINPISNDFNVSLFLELLNPLNSSDPAIASNVNRPNTAYLQVVNGATIHTVYEIEVTKTLPTAIKDPFATDSMGHLDYSGIIGFTTNTRSYVANTSVDANPWADATGVSGTVKIEPAGSNYTATNPKDGSQGFLWIGPKVSTYLQEPQAQAAFTPLEQNDASSTNRGLTYTIPQATGATLASTDGATVLLRRLVNPGLPPDVTTNPYVLVDYVTVQDRMIHDARKRLKTSDNSSYSATITTRMSYGRRQPFAGKDIVDAASSPPDLGAYKASTKTNASAPMHTFGSLNFNTQPTVLTNEINAATETAETPDWLSHFDRVPASPLSLLMVSTYRPHELTQKFLDQIPSSLSPGTNIWVPHQHAAGWMDEMTGLQRFFELVQTHGESSLTNAASQQVSLFPAGGRYQGRVNLNTVPIYQDGSGQYRSPVLEALFDANNSNRFSQDQIRALINSLGIRRASNVYFREANPMSRQYSVLESQTPAMVNSNDPWQNYAYGGGTTYNLNGNLVFDPFALDPTAQPNGAPLRTATQTTHPLVRLEALEKIHNQSTVRSNVFAIWLTVGFFEVLDSSTSPVKLGGEIGAAAGRNVRHKMFAMVDRTRIKSFETVSTAAVTPSLNAATGNFNWQPIPLSVTTITDPRTQKVYNLQTLAQQQPLVLTFDPDKETEETVEVWFTGGSLQAQFRGSHAAGCKIISRGNPGPMKNYDHKDDGDVVLYWTVLE